jgi:hypothetical protein
MKHYQAHVDPAAPEFQWLKPVEQARIYHLYFKWTVEALADEFERTTDTIEKWLDPEKQERDREQKRRYREANPEKIAELRRAWRATPKGRESMRRYMEGRCEEIRK